MTSVYSRALNASKLNAKRRLAAACKKAARQLEVAA